MGKILVIEDHPLNRQLMLAILENRATPCCWPKMHKPAWSSRGANGRG